MLVFKFGIFGLWKNIKGDGLGLVWEVHHEILSGIFLGA